jgi:hypothetical protein
MDARRIISKQQVTDLPLPTGPINTRIRALLSIKRLPVGGGV